MTLQEILSAYQDGLITDTEAVNQIFGLANPPSVMVKYLNGTMPAEEVLNHLIKENKS